MSDPREVVVGVGNPAMSDDGVGHRVVERLEGRPELDGTGVTLATTGTAAFLALEAISGADRAVVVDAVADGDADPGAVHHYRFRDGAFEDEVPNVLMHDLSFAEALVAGREAYDVPAEVVVVGVEPACLDVGLGLSDPVEAALPAVVETVLAQLASVDAAELHARRGSTGGGTNSGGSKVKQQEHDQQ